MQTCGAGSVRADSGTSQRDAFLAAVARKTADAVHQRLLNACRAQDIQAELERELGQIISELLHENKVG
jgi:hypothetical protein